MNLETLHELAAIADLLDTRLYDKQAAIDRLIADGRADVVGDRAVRLTDAGREWVGRK